MNCIHQIGNGLFCELIGSGYQSGNVEVNRLMVLRVGRGRQVYINLDVSLCVCLSLFLICFWIDWRLIRNVDGAGSASLRDRNAKDPDGSVAMPSAVIARGIAHKNQL